MTWMKHKWLYIITAAVIAVVLYSSLYNPYTGPDAIPEPLQINLAETELITHQGLEGPVSLELLASYDITAAVKRKQTYRTDYPSQISPVDLVLAWGQLNQKEIDQHIRYSQSNRWYYYQYDAHTPVSSSYIAQNSANVHIIPSNNRVASQIRRIRKNDTVRLTGYLVAARFSEGAWVSSLSRHDTGDGSCEIIYVESVTKIR